MPIERTTSYPKGSEAFARVANFSDGVIAIAITLLVLGITLPAPQPGGVASADIGAMLHSIRPQLMAFVMSFVIIAYTWLGHHRLFASLARVDNPLIVWNLAYLLLIVLVPLQSQLIGLYDNNKQAVILYALGFALLFLVDLAGLHLVWRRGLLIMPVSPATRRHDTAAKLIPVVVFLVSIPATLICGAWIAGWIWLLIWPLEAQLNRILKPR